MPWAIKATFGASVVLAIPESMFSFLANFTFFICASSYVVGGVVVVGAFRCMAIFKAKAYWATSDGAVFWAVVRAQFGAVGADVLGTTPLQR
jgi:hypothetical protein